MTDTIEIRWHGRGGQGTVTACKLFADACLNGGRFVQAFPEYGPERAGAPIRAYNRVSARELRGHYPVIRPNIVVVVDETLLESIDVTEGAPADAAFIINCRGNAADMRNRIQAGPTQKVVTVDATRIAIDTIGRPMPNAPLIGCVTRVSGMLSLQAALDDMARSFEKKFSQQIISGNLEATRRGFDEAVEQ
ncbi:2-oxoacid:acceptor oxidoreductase family protein [Pelobacter propionicus]|uniref:Pyruvate ferredoxin oxidoreductase, gamma subunit n=1 Tax=Pelobacter propionicus (strain DSM 2379 / NBRC 103807 / OttBd1) TaxID=338966 RepID=A1AKT6_PELPD|nr:2-oxoacid:acceptor oxidoreductase family protein [Pelobacter propionicus]ABK97956.1 pyruvate ferredoxin oxidoreductase, gamma subunit [Pelobacter propionicus DSM 2379]